METERHTQRDTPIFAAAATVLVCLLYIILARIVKLSVDGWTAYLLGELFFISPIIAVKPERISSNEYD